MLTNLVLDKKVLKLYDSLRCRFSDGGVGCGNMGSMGVREERMK